MFDLWVNWNEHLIAISHTVTTVDVKDIMMSRYSSIRHLIKSYKLHWYYFQNPTNQHVQLSKELKYYDSNPESFSFISYSWEWWHYQYYKINIISDDIAISTYIWRNVSFLLRTWHTEAYIENRVFWETIPEWLLKLVLIEIYQSYFMFTDTNSSEIKNSLKNMR